MFTKHHSLPPFRKCSNLRDRGYPYELPDLWPPNSPDINPIDYKILSIIQQHNQTKVQYVNDLMEHLTDSWAGVEQSIIDMPLTNGAGVPMRAFKPQEDTLNIHCDTN